MSPESEQRLEQYRADVRKVFQSMSMEALHFQNARIPWTDCIDRQEIDREYARRDRERADAIYESRR